ncbi:MAG: ATP-binding cassette domain-containing protein [Clostridiales bacterium]|jgi:putative ABC transport system ATP-binding protein|nr:ATP-binding cassette domain-containing protein [Clostridiales bacterium]
MINLKGITHSFGDNKLFNNFNLQVKSGEFVVIMGDNGAGKSTICNLISGALLPDSGEVLFDKTNVTKQNEHARAKYIAHVFQDPKVGTNSDMTVRENLSFAINKGKSLSLKRAVAKDNDVIFKERLEGLGLGLEDCLDQVVGTLSGGQRQALSLIMATFGEPKILLLDEHTAALDPQVAKVILAKTEEIVQKNKLTTIMITHNIPSAAKYGDRFIFMRRGEIVLDTRERLSNADIAELFE